MEIRTNRPSGFSTIVILMLVSFAAVAADVTADPPATEPQELDEVVVSAARLRELRDEVIRAEDQMIARYNELNLDDDLDIQCFKFTPTGTRLSHRMCMTKLQIRSQQKDGSEFLQYMRNADISNGAAPPALETGMRLLERWPDYRKNLNKLLEQDAALRELVVNRGELMRRYESERNRRVKGRVLLAD